MKKQLKRPLSILLAVLLAASLFVAVPTTASAETVQVFARKWVQADIEATDYLSFTDLYQNFIICRVNPQGSFNETDYDVEKGHNWITDLTENISLGNYNEIILNSWNNGSGKLSLYTQTNSSAQGNGKIYLSTNGNNFNPNDTADWYAYTWETFTADHVSFAPASCTEAGHEEYYTVGGRYFEAIEGTTDGHQNVEQIAQAETVIAATGHTLAAHAATAATCTTAGNSAYWSCDTCGKYFSDAEGNTEIAQDSWVIAATGHDLTAHAATAATCTTAGNSAYWSCDTCGKYFSDSEGNTEITENSWVIPALVDSTVTAVTTGADPIALANPAIAAQGYKGAKFLGFQKSALNNEETGTNSLRFVTELSSDVLNELKLNNADDYGYIFATVKSGGAADYNNLTVDSVKARKFSCKGTTNTVAGIYGDDTTATDYKYVTAAVNDIPTGVQFVARFYITYNGSTRYVDYGGPSGGTGVVFNTSEYL